MNSQALTSDDSLLTFKAKELRGSRLRCLMLTSMHRDQVASFLTQIVAPIGTVNGDAHCFAPKGFLYPDEPKLGEHKCFLTLEQREEVTNWWLKRKRGANTPNWDIVSKCTVDGEPGLILVEAKAHTCESKREGKKQGNAENDKQIGSAIHQANSALNSILPGWRLSTTSHYQLGNRFAWAWKLASIGIPTILVYLGFLKCKEMCDRGTPFCSSEDWEKNLKEHSAGIVPAKAWGVRMQTASAPIWALIRAAEAQWTGL